MLILDQILLLLPIITPKIDLIGIISINIGTNIEDIGIIIDNNAVKIDLTNSTINLINGTGIIGVNIGAIFDANISIIAIIEIIITLVYPVSNLNEKEI